MSLIIGLMSGTSMDGIDVALVDVANHHLHEAITVPYRTSTIEQLNILSQKKMIDIAELMHLHSILGMEFGEAVITLLNKTNQPRESISAIGSHGQTVYHDTASPTPYTLQLACPHRIAEITNMTVVADFRSRDIVINGQGAPFAPLYHQALFEKEPHPLAVLNIGGIANISLLTNEKTIGYDIGPGNCLMDAWLERILIKPMIKMEY